MYVQGISTKALGSSRHSAWRSPSLCDPGREIRAGA
jgi:hypothetical protein